MKQSRLLTLALAAVSCFAAEQTLTGKISDSKCGADHSAMEA